MIDTLAVQVEQVPEAFIVHLTGSASVMGAPALERALLQVSAQRPALTILDCAALESLSSLTMGLLVATQRSLVRNGGKMRLAAISELVMGSLRHTRLDTLFECFPTVADALATAR